MRKGVGGRQFLLESLGLMKRTRQRHRAEIKKMGDRRDCGGLYCLLACFCYFKVGETSVYVNDNIKAW